LNGSEAADVNSDDVPQVESVASLPFLSVRLCENLRLDNSHLANCANGPSGFTCSLIAE
jgi:hypothetical protein